MLNVRIFGTGMSADQAWRALLDIDGLDVEVVAFVDNDRSKHGGVHHDRPVQSPEDLVHIADGDCVVIASQWHVAIAEQLCALGFAHSQLTTWSGDHEELEATLRARDRSVPTCAAGRTVEKGALPRVLILSYETLNESHGTGVLLRRYFADFPESHLFSVSYRQSGRPWLPQSIRIGCSGPQASSDLRDALQSAAFVPDLVYATVLHEADLSLLSEILNVLPSDVPVIQHFMDFMPHDERAFMTAFTALLPRLTQVWALTDALQTMLTARLPCEVRSVAGLLQHVHAKSPQASPRSFDPTFRTAMIGNFYNPAVVEFIAAVWRACRAMRPGLGPVEWYVSPARLQALLDAGTDPGLDFAWRGFFGGTRLLRKLAQADLGLLALNQEANASTNYLRYSLPSRLTEFASAGVPLFAVASADTPLARYVARHGIGRTSSGPHIAAVAEDLVRFIDDRQARVQAGMRGRALAEREFRVERVRDWFNGEILALANSRVLTQAI